MRPLRAILIEDEPSGMENLKWKLEQNCPEVEIVAECPSGADAIQAIRRLLPDIIFLDIMLGDMTGFDVLKAIKHPSFETIFTTSYDDYAIQAIKNSALDYLLKPVEIEELMEAVAKARIKILQHAPPVQPAAAPVSSPSAKMGFPISTGQQFIEVNDIVFVQADDNVAVLSLADDKKDIRITKSLSWAEGQLENLDFCRIHNSYLINFNHMTEYIRNDGGYVVMSNGKAISISRRRKDAFMEKLDQWHRRS